MRIATSTLALLVLTVACSAGGDGDPVPTVQACTTYGGDVPGARTSLLAYYRPGGYPILLSQGGDEPSTATPFETWSWSCGWNHASGPDPQVWGYAMEYYPALHRTVLAGHRTLAWNGKRWEDLNVKPPLNLGSTAMVFDVVHDVLVLVDSYATGVNTWTFDGSSWKKASSSGPQNEAGAAVAFDPRSGLVMLVGGLASGSHGPQQATWCWNGSSWQLLEPDTAPPGGPGVMAYDEATRQLLLLTYDPSGAGVDTWEWTGKTWRQLQIDGPYYNVLSSMVYDPARRQLFLWNGSEAWTYTGTWARVPTAAG